MTRTCLKIGRCKCRLQCTEPRLHPLHVSVGELRVVHEHGLDRKIGSFRWYTTRINGKPGKCLTLIVSIRSPVHAVGSETVAAVRP